MLTGVGVEEDGGEQGMIQFAMAGVCALMVAVNIPGALRGNTPSIVAFWICVACMVLNLLMGVMAICMR